VASTGRRLVFEELPWVRFDDDGLLARQRGVVDNLLAPRQAGVIPGPTSLDRPR
jgi:hypothetical protein